MVLHALGLSDKSVQPGCSVAGGSGSGSGGADPGSEVPLKGSHGTLIKSCSSKSIQPD